MIFGSNRFAHVLCFRFAPLLNYVFFQRLSAGTGIEISQNIDKNLSEYPCDICGLGGNVRDCCIKRCPCAFHPSCCVFNSGKLFIEETETTEFLQLLCVNHSSESIVSTEIWHGVERILRGNLNFLVDF